MTVSIGEKAPAFTLFSSEKKPVSLEDYQGKNVVVLFFPAAFTSVCTAELCETRDSITLFNHLNAEVLGISVDSPFTLARFRDDLKLSFTLLSDFNKTVSTTYGALYEDFVFGMKGVSKRAAFIIDGSGTVRYAEVLENAGNLPNFVAIKETLSELNQLVG